MFSKLTGVCHGCFELILREMELIMHLNMNNFFFFGYMYVRCENINNNNNIGLWVVQLSQIGKSLVLSSNKTKIDWCVGLTIKRV